MSSVRLQFACEQIAYHDASATTIDNNGVDKFGAVVEVDSAEADLTSELLIGAEQQLLTGLTARIERAADLCAAKAAIVEQAAVLASERHTLRHHLVDDVHADFGEAMHVAFTGAEVAALNGVVEQAVHAVAIAAVVLGRVDAALSRNRVSPTR